MSFRFGWVLVFLVIQIILWFFWRLKDKKHSRVHPDASEKVKRVIRLNLDNKRIDWRNRMILIGFALLALAASGPQIGTRVRPIERKGVDLVIALDTSTSMDAEDVTPSRLAKAKFEL